MLRKTLTLIISSYSEVLPCFNTIPYICKIKNAKITTKIYFEHTQKWQTFQNIWGIKSRFIKKEKSFIHLILLQGKGQTCPLLNIRGTIPTYSRPFMITLIHRILSIFLLLIHHMTRFANARQAVINVRTAPLRSAGSGWEPSQCLANRFLDSSTTSGSPARPIRPTTRLRSIRVRCPWKEQRGRYITGQQQGHQ